LLGNLQSLVNLRQHRVIGQQYPRDNPTHFIGDKRRLRHRDARAGRGKRAVEVLCPPGQALALYVASPPPGVSESAGSLTPKTHIFTHDGGFVDNGAPTAREFG